MFFFGLSILISWIGLGTLINYLIFPKNLQDIWLRAGWGLCLTLLMGGILNLVGIISPTVVFLLIGGGNFILFIYIYSIKGKIWINIKELIRNEERNYILILLFVMNMTLLLIIYSGSISNIHFNWGEDFHGYFVFPQKMIQTGSMGSDPFSVQRILMLGGMSFLHSLILSLGDFRNLNMVDVGLGTILTIGLLYGFSRELNLSKWMNLLVIFIALIIVPPKVNISGLVIGLALFITLFRTLNIFRRSEFNILSISIIIALIISALSSLKTNYIITVFGFLFLSYSLYFFYYKNYRKKIIIEIILVAVFTILALLPWLLANYQSNGTMLYPILGKGFHGADYLQFNSNVLNRGLLIAAKVTILNMRNVPLFLFFFVCFIFRHSKLQDKRKNMIYLVVASITTPLIIVLLSGGYGWNRFSWSVAAASSLILLILAFASANSSNRYLRVLKFILIFVGIYIIIINNKTKLINHYTSQINSVSTGFKNENIEVYSANDYTVCDYIDDEIEQRYLKVQDSVPPGETILASTSYPFLFNFKRNNIYVAHFFGASSLPPGMPFFQGSEILTEYLLSQSLRYIIYSYKSEANFKYEDYKKLLSDNVSPWIRSLAEHTFDFHKNVEELGKNMKPIYDDGKIYVLDLESVLTK